MTEFDCAETRDLLPLYADGEIGPEERAALERHIGKCENCRAELDAIMALRSRIKTAGSHALPAGLAERIGAALDTEEKRPSAAPAWRRYAAMAASHLLVAVLASGIVYGILTSTRSDDRVMREIVNAHVRANVTNQLVQVASADTHTVKPWLASRLPFSPDVTDFAADGFPLVGGRVDYLLDRPVASLVYMRRKHPITVFVAPARDDALVQSASDAERNGYRVTSWREGPWAYVAVSDVGQPEFDEFTRLFRGK